MIFLDTHIWVWWVHEPGNLTQRQIDEIKEVTSDRKILDYPYVDTIK